MTKDYLIDHTRERLIEASAKAKKTAETVSRDATILILADENGVVIRGCCGGIFRTWFERTVTWDEVATDRENPILPFISAVAFQMDRQVAQPPESRQTA